MAYTLLPGVQQDHKGRYYQVGVYPNGKAIQVPYTHAPRVPFKRHLLPDDWTPPKVAEAQYEEKRKTRAVVEWRNPTALGLCRVWGPEEYIARLVQNDLMPLMRFDGRRWLVAFPGADWFVQYFEENKGG
jgi:hypothetical protein